MNPRIAGVGALALAFTASPASASGFAFYEHGAKASGQAGAWVARADDAAANWYNPAALVHLEGVEVQIGLNYLEVGADASFEPAVGGAAIDAVGNVSTPPHFFFSHKVNPRFAWGVGINTPFGLETEWDQPPLTFSSRHAILRTYLFNPNVAFAVNEQWSIGVGVDYLAAEVRAFSRDVNLGIPFGVTTADVTGEGDAWGYNIGFQFKRERFSLAAQYRSDMRPEIEGKIEFAGPAGNFLNSPATAVPDLPGQFLMGAAYLASRWDVEFSAYYTQWNMFKTLDINTPNPATSVSIREDWSPTWSYRLGGAFRLGSTMAHELRAGGVLDDSPVPSDTLRPSIPDSDRTGFSLGYGYKGKSFGIDAYGMYLDFEDGVAEGNPAEGVIDGVYKASVVLLGATFKYRF